MAIFLDLRVMLSLSVLAKKLLISSLLPYFRLAKKINCRNKPFLDELVIDLTSVHYCFEPRSKRKQPKKEGSFGRMRIEGLTGRAVGARGQNGEKRNWEC
jgi:hypothetical protein